MKGVFTTGQVAKICKVATRTVSNWVDSGRLKGFRIPGGGDRRIPQECLIKFMRAHGIPLGYLEERVANVFILTQDRLLIDNLSRELLIERSFKVAVVSSGFDCGLQVESFHPDCVVVDFSIGQTEALQVCQNLRHNDGFADVILVALLPDNGSSLCFDRSSINETFKKPFDVALFAERLRTLIGAKKELV
ncbi:MAG: helix-turn-helix domain-containing protein [bacterium]